MSASGGSPLPELDRTLFLVVRLLSDRGFASDITRRTDHDLPPASWALLEYLNDRGTMRVSAIAACQGVDTSSVTPRLHALESAQLVTRSRHPTDGRVSLISITAIGRAALEKIHAARRATLADATSDLSVDDLVATTRVLAFVVERLST